MPALTAPPAGILFAAWPGLPAPAGAQAPGILAPLLGRPLLQRALERLAEHGLRRIHVVVGDNAACVRALLGTGARWGCQLAYHYLPPAAQRRSFASFLSGLGVAGGDHFWLADATLVPTAALGDAVPAATGTHLCWRALGRLQWSGWGCFSGDWLLAQPVRFERDAIARRVLDDRMLRASVIPAPLSAARPAALLRAGRHLLAGDATAWIGRACRIHPSARILAPSWIGANVHIGAGAVVGPHAVIESGSYIDCNTRLTNAMVLPDTYIGADLEVRTAIVAGPCLHSVRHATCATISEPWLLADLASRKPRTAALERPLAGLLHLVLAPLAPLARRRNDAWSTHFAQAFLPGLRQVWRGRLRLAGPPRASAPAAAGLLNEALLLTPDARDASTRYASALLAAARQNDLPYAVRLLASYLRQALPALLVRQLPSPATYPENTMNLALETLEGGRAAIITIHSSHLDAGNVKDFKDAVQPLLDAHPAALIDMSALNFVDSSGLGALLSCLRTMNNKSGQLKLYAMDKPVQALFELVRMHRIFAIYNTRSDAIAAL